MNYQLPAVDDTLVWDAWLALYKVPAISVALELDIFESLDAMPASATQLADRRGFNERGLKALLPMLMQLGLLVQHGDLYQLSEAGRHYMLRSSAFFWGGVFKRLAKTIVAHKLLLETINNARENAAKTRPADGWESGHVDSEMAREVTGFMHSHSAPAAVGMVQACDLSQIRRLLDIGGGSGCFSIALARHYRTIECTVMDLPTICELAEQYIDDAGVAAQVDTVVVDMFRDDWPQGYDAHLFSNVFHDWSIETCIDLARSSYTALPKGGTILVHEMLLDDNAIAPAPAVAFSLLMAMGTKGQQFTFAQLANILQQAGFINVQWQPSYGYYSLISAVK